MDLPVIALFAGIWLIPAALIAPSRRLSGTHKLKWLLAAIVGSWAGWLLFAILAPNIGDVRVDELGHVHHPKAGPPGDGLV